jgi:purine nucleosidase
MVTLIHLDTDLGGDTDDLCALVMLLGWPGVELAAVTTCTERDGLRAAAAAYTLRLAGRESVPVVAGATGSLAGFASPPGFGDPERYWPEPLTPQPAPPGAAIDRMAVSIDAGATLAAVGPFTNLALLEAAHPGLLKSTEIVMMGGYVAPPGEGLPRWGPNMDANVQADTIAARIVFERSNPILVPVAVTLQVPLREAQLPALRAAGPLGRLIARQGELIAADWDFGKLGREHAGLPDDLLNFQHDPLACAVAAGWDGVVIEEMPLVPAMEGRWFRFRVDAKGKRTRVVTRVDAARFAPEWLQAVASAAAAA